MQPPLLSLWMKTQYDHHRVVSTWRSSNNLVHHLLYEYQAIIDAQWSFCYFWWTARLVTIDMLTMAIPMNALIRNHRGTVYSFSIFYIPHQSTVHPICHWLEVPTPLSMSFPPRFRSRLASKHRIRSSFQADIDSFDKVSFGYAVHTMQLTSVYGMEDFGRHVYARNVNACRPQCGKMLLPLAPKRWIVAEFASARLEFGFDR